MATLWRYMVVSADASADTTTWVDEKCSQVATTVKPSSAP